MNPWEVIKKTGINELANKPRYDITGERYGNTLSDDMFSIKNPARANQHTPESYEYFDANNVYDPPTTWTPATGTYQPQEQKVPTLQDYFDKYVTPGPKEDFRENAVSRQKNVTEGNGDLFRWGSDPMINDILEMPEYYDQDLINWASDERDKEYAEKRRYDLSAEGLRDDMYYASHPAAYRDEYMSPRRDADIDYYLGGELVDYNALSPATLKQLAKMGVNRPEDYKDPNRVIDYGFASDYLNYLVGVYQDLMAKGVIK